MNNEGLGEMTEKVSLAFNNRNPDVLTSIANLSSDEVFTPPDFANIMLNKLAESWAMANNGEDIWSNPSATFLDPFTKSGVFLREITRRLSKGLEEAIPEVQERINHITSKQVFGMSITSLTGHIARRSVYCSKQANGKHSISTIFETEAGNIWFERQEHTWINEKCSYCGASKSEYDRGTSLESHAYALIHTTNPKELLSEIFGENVKFDVVIGNPPYQLSDGEDVFGASPIYHNFVNQAKALDPRFLCMVIPARWYSGGKGLDKFREEMLKDTRLRVLEDFPDSSQVFPGTQIKGGVCFFLWDRDNKGKALVRNHIEKTNKDPVERNLLEQGSDVFIRYNEALPILAKILIKTNGSAQTKFEIIEGQRFFDLVSSAKPFGFRTFFKGSEKKKNGQIKIFQNGGVGYIDRKTVVKNKDLIDAWKVFIPRAGSGSDSYPHSILGTPFVGSPGTVCSETYNCIGPFSTEVEAQNVQAYITSKIFRFLVLLRKSSQDANRNVYKFVPMQDFSVNYDDDFLRKKYAISESEWTFIESMVRPMELTNE